MRPEEIASASSGSPLHEDPSFVPGSNDAAGLERFAESTSYDQRILPLELPHEPALIKKQPAHIVSL